MPNKINNIGEKGDWLDRAGKLIGSIPSKLVNALTDSAFIKDLRVEASADNLSEKLLRMQESITEYLTGTPAGGPSALRRQLEEIRDAQGLRESNLNAHHRANLIKQSYYGPGGICDKLLELEDYVDNVSPESVDPAFMYVRIWNTLLESSLYLFGKLEAKLAKSESELNAAPEGHGERNGPATPGAQEEASSGGADPLGQQGGVTEEALKPYQWKPLLPELQEAQRRLEDIRLGNGSRSSGDLMQELNTISVEMDALEGVFRDNKAKISRIHREMTWDIPLPSGEQERLFAAMQSVFASDELKRLEQRAEPWEYLQNAMAFTRKARKEVLSHWNNEES